MEKLKETLKKYNLVNLTRNINVDTIKDFSGEKITVKCNNCGEIFSITIKQLVSPHPARDSTPCPRCKSKTNFINQLIKLYGRNPYEFISQYIDQKTSLTVKCLDCGDIFTVDKAAYLLCTTGLPKGAHPCKKCSELRNKENKNIEDLKKAVIEKTGSFDYEILNPEEYNGMYNKNTRLKVKCTRCGFIFEIMPQNLLHPRNGDHYCEVCNNRKKTLISKEDYHDHCLKMTPSTKTA
jgi:uncharacterized Zn finger protein